MGPKVKLSHCECDCFLAGAQSRAVLNFARLTTDLIGLLTSLHFTISAFLTRLKQNNLHLIQ